MNELSKYTEYKLLGQMIKLDGQSDEETARLVLKDVKDKCDRLESARPGLTQKEVAILVALEIAQEKQELKGNYKRSLDEIESLLRDTLSHLPDESPDLEA